MTAGPGNKGKKIPSYLLLAGCNGWPSYEPDADTVHGCGRLSPLLGATFSFFLSSGILIWPTNRADTALATFLWCLSAMSWLPL